MKTMRSEFSIKGVWHTPDVDALQAFARDGVMRFLAGDAVTVRLVRLVPGGAIQEEVQLDLADDWRAAITPDVKSLAIHGYAAARSFSLYWALPAQLNVSAGGDDRDAAVALVEQARQALALDAEANPAHEPTRIERYSLSRNYLSPRLPDLAWLDTAVELLKSFNDASFSAGYRLASSPTILRTAGLGELRERMQSGAVLLEWSVDVWRADGREAHLSHGQSGSIVLRASDRDEAPLLALDTDARQRLALVVATLAPEEQTKGLSRRGFMRQHPDIAWFDGLVATLRRIVGAGASITGRLRTVQNEEMTFGAVDVWRQALASGWGDVARAGLWCVGPAGSVNVDVDLRRELVTTTFNLRSAIEVDAVAEQFGTACDLESAREDAYRYRKYGRSYRVKEWLGNQPYGDAVVKAVQLAFDGRPVAVMSAFVEAGEPTASLESFATVADFAAWFATDRPFQNASLMVEGFQGRHLGLHVDRLGGSFRILASLNGTLFDKVDQQFESAFVRTDKKETGDKLKPGPSELSKTFITGVLALLGAVTGATWNFVNASREAPDLRIVYPPDKAELKASTVDVQWSYRESRVLGKPRWSADRPATITLLGDDKPARTIADGRGHAVLKDLDPGSYTIIVSVPDGPSETRQITIKAAGPGPTSAPAKID